MDVRTLEVLASHDLLQVLRVVDAGGGTIIQKDGGGQRENWTALCNEIDYLRMLEGCGYTPNPLGLSRFLTHTYQEDLGDNQALTDPELFRRNCVKMLATFRAASVRHGDLTGPRDDGRSNIINRGNHPWAVDWQEAHRLGEPGPQKSPYTDSWLLMRTLAGWEDVNGEADTPRVARRWKAVLEDLGLDLYDSEHPYPYLGKTFLDLGCFQGDFPALAAAEGMIAYGVDRGGFRSGENSITIAEDLWRDFPHGLLHFSQVDFARTDLLPRGFAGDVVMMFSTWPYVVRDYGQTRAEAVLASCIGQAERFYFETQIFGDGPGPEFLKRQSDVEAMLVRLGGQAKRLVTVPVTGRNAERVVWRVTRA